MSITDRTKVFMAVPEYDTDKIIGIVPQSTLNVAAPTAISTVEYASATLNPGFGEDCYFRGIFSYDGGTTWNDFGSQQVDTGGGFPTFQTVGMTWVISPAGILTVTAENWYNYTTGSGSARTILYKGIFIAKNNQGAVQPLATNEDTYWSSLTNFHKIFIKDEVDFNMTSGVALSVPVTHGLGYAPKVRAFLKETNGSQRMVPLSLYQIDIFVTENIVTFSLEAFRSATTRNAQIEYRIYIDG